MDAQAFFLPASAGNSLGPVVPVVNTYCKKHWGSSPPRDKLCLDCAAFALCALEGWPPAEAVAKVQEMAVGASQPLFRGPSSGLTNQPLPGMPSWDNEQLLPALNGPQISPQMGVCGRQPVPESGFVVKTPSLSNGSESSPKTPPSSRASSDEPELKKCSCCGKWLTKPHFLKAGGKLAATCEHCRSTRRPYYKKKVGLDTQRCTACQKECPIEDFDKTARERRKCIRCREQGRLVSPAQDLSPRGPSKVSQMPEERGKKICSGCKKSQDKKDFFNYDYGTPRERSTCLFCRKRKQAADRKKRERRQAQQ
ncbi:unnamed protein product [Clonostachys byssicola]|uniref:Uncharacterized protein n=1 Tax=Clonostachys byssicola TaxID=160290 RepID=A0A9N9YD12_9HYPO|nr:unnamed protein product [Clonostachys byssicola]